MPFCPEYGFEMPEDFPVAELTDFMREARRALVPAGSASQAWKEFAGASNLIGWRFRASSDAWVEYKTSLQVHGDGAAYEELYKREGALFMMFCAGVSCIEAASYALAAASSHPEVLDIEFGVEAQRACTPARLRRWLAPHAKAAALRDALERIVAAEEWKLFVDLRNRMSHRSNLPRVHNLYTGSTPPPTKLLNFAATSSTRAVEADVAEFDAVYRWLASTLRELLVSGNALLRAASGGSVGLDRKRAVVKC